MSKKGYSIIDYLNLKDIGYLELAFVLTPIMMGFTFMSLPLSLLMWLFLIASALLRFGRLKTQYFKPLLFFIVYWLLHDIVMMLIDDVNINGFISHIIYFVAIFVLYPSLNVIKLRGAFNWVAIISIIGLLYQWWDITNGNVVHPLEIPGLQMSKGRLDLLSARPSSFFMEPAAYVAFMLCPLYLALIERKYVWAMVMILSIFLTTSTTGIVLSFVLLVATLFSNKTKRNTTIISIVILSVLMVYSLRTFEEFDAGVEKMENVNASTNIRLSQGPNVVKTMNHNELIFGAPYSTAYRYCINRNVVGVVFYGESVYMSTFWNMILCYGLVGLVLYLLIYWNLYKRSRIIWPFLICVCATLFSDPDMLEPQFAFKLIFMLVICKKGSFLFQQEEKYVNYLNLR